MNGARSSSPVEQLNIAMRNGESCLLSVRIVAQRASKLCLQQLDGCAFGGTQMPAEESELKSE